MPGNIYHFVVRQSLTEPRDDKNKNNQENINKKWKSRYEYDIPKDKTSQLSFIKRAELIYAALANDFYFDILT